MKMGAGIIFCRCRGEIARGIDLDRVAASLSHRFPLVISEALCETPGDIAALLEANKCDSVIIGACSTPEYLESFRNAVRDGGGNRFSVHLVNIREQCAMVHSCNDAAAKAAILLRTQACIAEDEVGPENLKVSFGVPAEGVTRRELFHLLNQPKYTIIPSIRSDVCTSKWGCRLCLSSCHSASLVAGNGTVRVNKAECDGCGACIPACPWDAIRFPSFTPEILDGQMAGLVDDGTTGLSPRVLLIHCKGSESILNQMGAAAIRYPASIIPYRLPCLATLSPFLVLRAFQLGAGGVAVLPCQNGCLYDLELTRLRRALGFLHQLLPHLGLGKERLLEIANGDLPTVSKQLRRMTEAFQNSSPPPVPTRTAYSPASPFSPLVLARLLQKTSVPFIIEGNEVPFGLVNIKPELCSACRLCASVCRSGALAFEKPGAELELVFRHSLCIACGECVRVCPVKALKVRRALESTLIGVSRSILRVGTINCPNCGEEIAPAPLLNVLRQKLEQPEQKILDALHLCPACRLKRLSGLVLQASREAMAVQK